MQELRQPVGGNVGHQASVLWPMRNKENEAPEEPDLTKSLGKLVLPPSKLKRCSRDAPVRSRASFPGFHGRAPLRAPLEVVRRAPSVARLVAEVSRQGRVCGILLALLGGVPLELGPRHMRPEVLDKATAAKPRPRSGSCQLALASRSWLQALRRRVALPVPGPVPVFGTAAAFGCLAAPAAGYELDMWVDIWHSHAREVAVSPNPPPVRGPVLCPQPGCLLEFESAEWARQHAETCAHQALGIAYAHPEQLHNQWHSMVVLKQLRRRRKTHRLLDDEVAAATARTAEVVDIAATKARGTSPIPQRIGITQVNTFETVLRRVKGLAASESLSRSGRRCTTPVPVSKAAGTRSITPPERTASVAGQSLSGSLRGFRASETRTTTPRRQAFLNQQKQLAHQADAGAIPPRGVRQASESRSVTPRGTRVEGRAPRVPGERNVTPRGQRADARTTPRCTRERTVTPQLRRDQRTTTPVAEVRSPTPRGPLRKAPTGSLQVPPGSGLQSPPTGSLPSAGSLQVPPGSARAMPSRTPPRRKEQAPLRSFGSAGRSVAELLAAGIEAAAAASAAAAAANCIAQQSLGARLSPSRSARTPTRTQLLSTRSRVCHSHFTFPPS